MLIGCHGDLNMAPFPMACLYATTAIILFAVIHNTYSSALLPIMPKIEIGKDTRIFLRMSCQENPN